MDLNFIREILKNTRKQTKYRSLLDLTSLIEQAIVTAEPAPASYDFH